MTLCVCVCVCVHMWYRLLLADDWGALLLVSTTTFLLTSNWSLSFDKLDRNFTYMPKETQSNYTAGPPKYINSNAHIWETYMIANLNISYQCNCQSFS